MVMLARVGYKNKIINVSVLLAGFLMLFGGCDVLSLDERSGNIEDLIQRNRESWEEENISTYRIEYNKTVGGDETGNIEVTVRGGSIDSTSVEEGEIENEDDILTVDLLFEEIVNNYEREDRGSFQVSFNEQLSYPERYRMLPGESTLGRGVVVVHFESLEGTD